MTRILLTEVWCTANTEESIKLGLPEGDSWMPIVIDLKSIVAIKLSGETEFLGNDKATVYFSYGSSLTINVAYEKAIKLWKEAIL